MNADDERRSAAVIELLTKEYESLRGQLVMNLVQTAGLSALGVTAVALLFGLGGAIPVVLIGGILVSAIGGFSYYAFMRTNVLLSHHIAALETRINHLARDAYGVNDDLLTWESRFDSGELSLQAPGYRTLRRRVHSSGSR